MGVECADVEDEVRARIVVSVAEKEDAYIFYEANAESACRTVFIAKADEVEVLVTR